jgi:uncharacterized membrane protein
MTSDPARSLSIPITGWLLVLTLAAVAAHLAYYYPQLPDTIASHFGPSGQPDDWSSKRTYAAVILAIAAVLALAFLGIGLLLRRLPDYMINLPNRDYWLAPPRRDGAIATLMRLLHWFGLATLALLIAMNQLVFNANLHSPANLSSASWLLIGAYLAFALVWTTGLLWRFRVSRNAHTAQQL